MAMVMSSFFMQQTTKLACILLMYLGNREYSKKFQNRTKKCCNAEIYSRHQIHGFVCYKSGKQGYGWPLSFFLFNFLYKHLYTCLLAYLHTCTLAYLHTFILLYLHMCIIARCCIIRFVRLGHKIQNPKFYQNPLRNK